MIDVLIFKQKHIDVIKGADNGKDLAYPMNPRTFNTKCNKLNVPLGPT
jgi:hypothetical protein